MTNRYSLKLPCSCQAETQVPLTNLISQQKRERWKILHSFEQQRGKKKKEKRKETKLVFFFRTEGHNSRHGSSHVCRRRLTLFNKQRRRIYLEMYLYICLYVGAAVEIRCWQRWIFDDFEAGTHSFVRFPAAFRRVTMLHYWIVFFFVFFSYCIKYGKSFIRLQ